MLGVRGFGGLEFWVQGYAVRGFGVSGFRGSEFQVRGFDTGFEVRGLIFEVSFSRFRCVGVFVVRGLGSAVRVFVFCVTRFEVLLFRI